VVLVLTCFGATVFADNTQSTTEGAYRIGGFVMELNRHMPYLGINQSSNIVPQILQVGWGIFINSR
jgi:hypothetical protein